MKRFLLSRFSAELLETVGLWLIILGLIGEAALVFSLLETTFEKPLTFVFTLAIAAGVWIESIGAADISSEKDVRIADANARASEAQLALAKINRQLQPRSLKEDEFLKELAGKPKHLVKIVFLRSDQESFLFAQRLKDALMKAKWPVSIPLDITAEAMAKFVRGRPAGITDAPPKGVSIGWRADPSIETSLFDLSFQISPPGGGIKVPWRILGGAVEEGIRPRSVSYFLISPNDKNAPPKGALLLIVGPKEDGDPDIPGTRWKSFQFEGNK